MLAANTKAPAFSAKDQHGNTVSLADFKGKKLALYFYPKDDTPGCTTQACNLRDNLESLAGRGIQVIGVSTDGKKSHQKFVQKYDLNFPLLADEGRAIVEAYDVWGEKQFMGRTIIGTHRVTYLINEQGLIQDVIEKVETGNHAAQILAGFGINAG